ncbi:hypothetical protein [Streptosporangium sp. H16]|uniref:hypothetical protein n=1 Tax=Streptosporangium sp. H16 TaxID=3444184 RepID=UPI003F79A28D
MSPKLRRVVDVLSIAVPIASAMAGNLAVNNPPGQRSFWYLAAALLVIISIALLGLQRGRRPTKLRLSQAEEYPGEVLRRRVERVNEAFVEAATLMADLQRDLAAQQAAREELIAKADEQQRLLAVDQEQAENIRQILLGETKATIRAERRREMLFLGAGMLMSIPIGVLVNYIS